MSTKTTPMPPPVTAAEILDCADTDALRVLVLRAWQEQTDLGQVCHPLDHMDFTYQCPIPGSGIGVYRKGQASCALIGKPLLGRWDMVILWS